MRASREPDLTLFAVIRIDRDRPVSDLDRFIALSLPSFRTHLPAELVREIVVAVPPSDVQEATNRLGDASHVPLRVIDEREVAGGMTGTPGWVRQQILKLAAPAVVRTPWFVTLDADVVATRDVDREFLFPGGRAIWEQERAKAHWSWWESSARLLGLPVPLEPDTPSFGVTPAIMHTDSVRGLAQAIEDAHPERSWRETLRAPEHAGWTEYSLYWTHLVISGRASELYSDNTRVPYALNQSVWTAGSLEELNLPAVFDPEADHAFFVFQSNLELPLAETVKLLRPYLQADIAISPAELWQWAKHTQAHELRTVRHRLSARLRGWAGRS